MVDLGSAPFFLTEAEVNWVERTLGRLTLDEKVGQLFCLVAREGTEEEIAAIFKSMYPGAIMYRVMPLEVAHRLTRIIDDCSDVPVLIAANLEKGGNGIVTEGTYVASPMLAAATDDERYAYELGVVCARESRAVGCNWSFAPVVDVDFNFRNPITNTRTFGSDPERVARMAGAYIDALQSNGVAACAKHFPGDGVDERDQHIVTSVNTLPCDAWDETYGTIYRHCISRGVRSIMTAHIQLPAYSRCLRPDLPETALLPASLAHELTTELLRKRLGFNGLIITDATTMAGFEIPLPRSLAVPQSIAAGCDMFLFTRNLDEDYRYMKAGVEDGLISSYRLDDAVRRILALKASCGLGESFSAFSRCPDLSSAQEIVGRPEHAKVARECADKGITLVKMEEGVLPLSPSKFPRVLCVGIESEQETSCTARSAAVEFLWQRLRDEGFAMSVLDPGTATEGRLYPTEKFLEKYDLILYVANMPTKSNQTVVRIEWAEPMATNVPIHVSSVPTVFISIENPYHLLDVPRVRTYINTYSSSDIVLESLIDKLMGRSAFTGISPGDPFCGLWDTRL